MVFDDDKVKIGYIGDVTIKEEDLGDIVFSVIACNTDRLFAGAEIIASALGDCYSSAPMTISNSKRIKYIEED